MADGDGTGVTPKSSSVLRVTADAGTGVSRRSSSDPPLFPRDIGTGASPKSSGVPSRARDGATTRQTLDDETGVSRRSSSGPPLFSRDIGTGATISEDAAEASRTASLDNARNGRAATRPRLFADLLAGTALRLTFAGPRAENARPARPLKGDASLEVVLEYQFHVGAYLETV